jgi:hypothetical protein
MCGGSITSTAARAEELYQKEKKDYGDLPSLALGDKVKRKPSSERMGDVKKPADNAARSLLMPYMK